jgi:hypothetical protein
MDPLMMAAYRDLEDAIRNVWRDTNLLSAAKK